jgi:Cu-Zn family superoxide dismutase
MLSKNVSQERKTIMFRNAAISFLIVGALFHFTTSEAKTKTANSVQVDLHDAKGETVGHATMTEEKKGVQLKVEVTKLSEGEHGIHLHETGKCEGPDFKSAGAHFNPDKKAHGLENPKGSHLGDMPNLKVGADGKGQMTYLIKKATLKPGSNSLMDADGTAVVIHAKQDDQKNDPSGNSGDRIACGVLAAP